MSQKVYVIKPPENEKRSVPDEIKSTGHTARPRSRNLATGPVNPAAARDGWRRILMAYLLGPVTFLTRSSDPFRFYWAALGIGSAAAAVVLALGRPAGTAVIRFFPGGPSAWIAVTAFVVLAAATAWARAVALAGGEISGLASVSPRRIRRPLTVGALGLVLPGIGYMMKARARRAARSLWSMGPLALALIVLANWRLLWDHGRWQVSAGPSGLVLEVVFVGAAATAVLFTLFWIVQALDGGRRFCNAPGRGDRVGLALLIALVALVSTVRPAPFAQSLSALSAGLHTGGFRLIPLALYETAARLDPACPTHLAGAAALNEDLGMDDAARAKRTLIERRYELYAEVVHRDTGSERLARVFSTVALRRLPAFGTGAGGTLAGVNGVLRAELEPGVRTGSGNAPPTSTRGLRPAHAGGR